jgi:hypothetical protein
VSLALSIGETAGGENHCTVSSAYDTAAKAEAPIIAGSYTKSAVRALITAGFLVGKGLRCHKPVVMWITVGYYGSVGEGGGEE